MVSIGFIVGFVYMISGWSFHSFCPRLFGKDMERQLAMLTEDILGFRL